MSDLNHWSRGDRIGEFMIQSELGRGYEGVVFVVTDLRPGQNRKFRTLKLFRGANAIEDVRHTIEHWQRFQGIGSVKSLVEWGIAEGHRRVSQRPWVVFDYVRGNTLADAIRFGRIRDPVQSTMALLQALVPVHRQGLAIGDHDRGRNVIIEYGTARYVFVDMDAGGPTEPAPGQEDDVEEVTKLARLMWRRLGVHAPNWMMHALDGSVHADQALRRLQK